MLLPLLQLGRAGLISRQYASVYPVISSRITIPYVNLQRRKYCTQPKGDNKDIKDPSAVDSPILLVEKSLADKTYKKFYFSNEDAYAPEDKPSVYLCCFIEFALSY